MESEEIHDFSVGFHYKKESFHYYLFLFSWGMQFQNISVENVPNLSTVMTLLSIFLLYAFLLWCTTYVYESVWVKLNLYYQDLDEGHWLASSTILLQKINHFSISKKCTKKIRNSKIQWFRRIILFDQSLS